MKRRILTSQLHYLIEKKRNIIIDTQYTKYETKVLDLITIYFFFIRLMCIIIICVILVMCDG